MSSTVSKQIGNTKITVHSKSGFLYMSPEEQREYFRKLQEAGDPVICRIAETMSRLHYENQGA